MIPPAERAQTTDRTAFLPAARGRPRGAAVSGGVLGARTARGMQRRCEDPAARDDNQARGGIAARRQPMHDPQAARRGGWARLAARPAKGALSPAVPDRDPAGKAPRPSGVRASTPSPCISRRSASGPGVGPGRARGPGCPARRRGLRERGVNTRRSRMRIVAQPVAVAATGPRPRSSDWRRASLAAPGDIPGRRALAHER